MKVLFVYDGHWPHNATRLVKQADSLIAAGHEVTILSRGTADLPSHESSGGLTAVRLPFVRSALLNRLASFPVFLNPLWIHYIRRTARRSSADCIVVLDLPLAPAAIHVGRGEGLPVHYDMVEVYPVGLHSILPHESGLFLRVVRATGVAEAIERWVLKRVVKTYVVSHESRDRCLRLGVPADRLVIVGNTPANLEALRADWPVPDDIRDLAGRPAALFVGNVFADRGLAFAIDAMTHVVKQLPNAVLIVVGDGRERPRLEKQVARLGLGDHVRFLGWKHHSEHPAYLRHSQIGLLPFADTLHINITLANKLFDYMGAGLPVLASDVVSMRRVLAETKGGVVVKAGDVHALAEQLVRLFSDAPLRRQLGMNGMQAIAAEYTWANDARRFVHAIEHPTAG